MSLDRLILTYLHLLVSPSIYRCNWPANPSLVRTRHLLPPVIVSSCGDSGEHCERHVFWPLECLQHHTAHPTGVQAAVSRSGWLKTTSPTGHNMWGHRTVSPSGHWRVLFWLQSCSHTYTSDSAPQPATCRSSMRNPQLPASSLTEMIGSTGEEIQNFVDWCLRTASRVTLEKPRSCQWTSAGDKLLHLHWWASRVRTLSSWPPTSTWIFILRINLSGPTTWTLYIGRVTPTLPTQETEVCWCTGDTLQDFFRTFYDCVVTIFYGVA